METIIGDDQLWKVSKPINKGGRPVLFEKPEDLYQKALDYFAWVDAHPWQDKAASNGMTEATNKTGESQGKTNSMTQHVKALRKPYTLYGFCAFANISSKWADFRRNYAEREGFLEVLTWIENIVTSEQVEGAMIHRYDGSLVARLNGIADTTKTEITGKDGESLFALPKLSLDDIEELKKLNGLQ